MERGHEIVEGSRSHQSTLTGALALKNFTIPRKKQASGEVFLEHCSEKSRDYSFIHAKLRDSKLDKREDQANTWVWGDVCLVRNEELLKKFSEKRAEMRAKGRHGREMEERFCFLAASDQMTGQIYQHGLRVGNTVHHALGKPSHGVYLFRHVDVALKSSTSAKKLIIFKVLYGKVKELAPSLDCKKMQDPIVVFDCHMYKDVVTCKDSLHQQLLGSSIFLFDFNEMLELTERPRQCLPYAVVSVVSVSMTVPTSLPVFPSMLMIGQRCDNYKACTLEEGGGKGSTTTITFKHVGTPGSFEMDYSCKNPEVQAQIPKTAMQNTQSFNTNQYWNHTCKDLSMGPMPNMDHTALSQCLLAKKQYLSNPTRNTACMYGSNDNKWGAITQSQVDKFSTIAYSSLFESDPCLSRQEANQQSNCSGAEAAYCVSGFDTRKCQPAHQNQEKIRTFAGCSNESSDIDKKEEKDKCHQYLHTQTLPSIKLFKMKFQKYSAYFRMNEEERHQNIWSQENMSLEEKQELADRIHFYEVYYQKYKQGLLFQNVSDTKKISSWSQSDPPKNSILHTKGNKYEQNQFIVCQSQCHDVTSFAENTFINGDKWGTSHIQKPTHTDHPEHSTEMMMDDPVQDHLQETHQDCADLSNRGLVPSPDIFSERSLMLGSMKSSLTGVKPVTQGANHKIECEHELSRCKKEESHQNESTPGVNMVEKPNAESSHMYANVTGMDIASCIELFTCNTSDCNLGSGMATKQEQIGKSCKPSEISPYTQTVQQDNTTHMELYKRLQIDQLLSTKSQKHALSSRSFLIPRVMSRSRDVISKLNNESKKHRKAYTNLNMKSWQKHHLIVTLKDNKCPAHNRQKLSLSERFSKLKGLQKKLSRRNKKIIQTQHNSEGHKEMATCNAKLIQVLAKRYSKSKFYVKLKSLRHPCLKKQDLSQSHSLKRSKFDKKTKANKNFIRTAVLTEGPYKTVNIKAPSDSLNNLLHPSEIVPIKNKDKKSKLSVVSQTSDSDENRLGLHIQCCEEADSFTRVLQDHCCAPISVISKDLTQSLGFSTILETKQEATNPTDSQSDDYQNVSNDLISPLISRKVDNEEQEKTISIHNKTSLITSTSNDYGSHAECKGKNLLLNVTSEVMLNPLNKEHFTMKIPVDGNVDASESLTMYHCEASKKYSDVAKSNTNNSHITVPQRNITPCTKVKDSINETVKGTIKFEQNTSMKREHMSPKIQNMNQSCLTISTNTDGSSVWNTNLEVFEDTSKSKTCGLEVLEDEATNIVDLSDDDSALTDNREISSEYTKCSNTNLLVSTESSNTPLFKGGFDVSMGNQNKSSDSPETQIISKLRDYLTKFESSVKKQEAVNDDLKERPVVWITLDSTMHRQQLVEKAQYCMVNFPGSEPIVKGNCFENIKTYTPTRKAPQSGHAQIGTHACLLVPAESERRRQSYEAKYICNHKSRRSSVPSVSSDSASALDSVKDNTPLPLGKVNKCSRPISNNITTKTQVQLQSNNTIDQLSPSMNKERLYEQKSEENNLLISTLIIDDENVRSTFSDTEYSISEISNTLKMADQTTSLAELGSLQSKCKNMLQHFISNFEQDQKVPFRQCFVSRCLILEHYLDQPPAQVDLRYEAVNSYLELQMMMEAWQFVENKINFIRGEPTFRSLLWYDSSLYGELYKGEFGFQQQSPLFASFQKTLAQDGCSKLQEYYSVVSSLHQKLHTATDVSYYMYLKSKRELLEIEAALRNPHNIKSFFLSIPVAAMINLGDTLERLEKVHKIIMTFVETPSDQLPGTFDVGKAEHLSITCRYLQEKCFFMRSCKKTISKISWFGIEHLLYDASKILLWQDLGPGVLNEVLKTQKNSNPHIIFGTTESGVTLVNNLEQTPPTVAKQRNDTKEHKCLQLWRSSPPSVAQRVMTNKEVAYKMCKRRATHPAMNNKGVSPHFQTFPNHLQSHRPYYALPHSVDPGHWGSTAANRSVSTLASSSLMSHAIPEINSHLSKRQVTFSHSDESRPVANAQTPQRPSFFTPQETFRGDSCITHSAFESVKYQQTNTAEHCPGLSQKEVNQFSLTMTQPYNIPKCSLNAHLRCSPVSVQTLTHVSMPSPITTIHYPFFLLNGQTYTTSTTTSVHPD